MSLRVGFDVDGVLANFGRAVRDLATRAGMGQVGSRDMKRIWEIISGTPQWWLELVPYERDQIDRLYRASRERRWEVYFLTTRPPSAGETPQFQTQWWLEQHGFALPSVLTVPGSRGDLANALRLDVVVDDHLSNCTEIVAASRAKAIVLLRRDDPQTRQEALDRGIGAVGSLREALDAIEHFEYAKQHASGRLTRLAEWFKPSAPPAPGLPIDARGTLGRIDPPDRAGQPRRRNRR